MGADFTINKPDPELFYFIGDDAMDSYAYAPVRVPMRAGTFLEFQPVGGRPTSFMTPYYRYEYQDEGIYLTVAGRVNGAPALTRGILKTILIPTTLPSALRRIRDKRSA